MPTTTERPTPFVNPYPDDERDVLVMRDLVMSAVLADGGGDKEDLMWWLLAADHRVHLLGDTPSRTIGSWVTTAELGRRAPVGKRGLAEGTVLAYHGRVHTITRVAANKAPAGWTWAEFAQYGCGAQVAPWVTMTGLVIV